mgnify:CR=1 FL=1
MKLEDRKKLLIQLLKSRGIQFEKGLTNEELITVEANFDITFPPDLQTLLCLELPVSKEFVNWRKALSSKEYEDEVFDKLNRPLEGMLFDIENNAFWDENWGEKPEIFEQQKEIATQNFKKYPKLIPIYSNRYIPSKPHETGNPILSVHQMDIIYYGFDLATYFRNEFHLTYACYQRRQRLPAPARRIQFPFQEHIRPNYPSRKTKYRASLSAVGIGDDKGKITKSIKANITFSIFYP